MASKKMKLKKDFAGFAGDDFKQWPKGTVLEGDDLALVMEVQPKWLGPVTQRQTISDGAPATTEADESAAVEK